MGTLESKVKEGYSVKQRPLFKTKVRYGARPLINNQAKSLSPATLTSGYVDTKVSYDPLRHSTCTNDTENSEIDVQI
jgi:hypothetical protein